MSFVLLVQNSLVIRQAESAPSLGIVTSSPFVGRSGRDLILYGKKFRTVGVNRYNLLTINDPYMGCAGQFSDADLTAWFNEIDSMGVTSVRFWVFQSFTQSGTQLSRFDQILSLARERDIKVIPVLENHWKDCTQGGEKTAYWYKDGYKHPIGAYTLSYRDYVANMVERYKHDPVIMAWQLMNEAETNHQVLYAFADDISSLIKSIDKNHLVSLGTIGSGQQGASATEYRVLHALPTIDIVEYHDYHEENDAFPSSDMHNSLEARFSDGISLDKPIMMGEAGIPAGCTNAGCFSYVDRANLFEQKMDEFFSRGGAAYLLWSYRDHWEAPLREFDFDLYDPLISVIRAQSQQL
jgi:mannan endo-1,4-beta-mannosidase